MPRMRLDNLVTGQINVPNVHPQNQSKVINNSYEDNITHTDEPQVGTKIISSIKGNNIHHLGTIDNLNKKDDISHLLTTSKMTTATNSSGTGGADGGTVGGGSYADWFQLPKMDNFVDAFSLGCSTAVIFGGLIPYIPQYLKIKHSMSSDGFSTYVCLTLLIANILRIAFWFGHHFELPLLIQSFVMITGMLAMMEICIRVKDKGSSYIISSIDFNRNQANANNGRRSLIGKIFGSAARVSITNSNLDDIDGEDDELHSESKPIYSVSSDSPQTASLLPKQESYSQSSSYQNHQQQQHETPAAAGEIRNDISISNDSTIESPILNCCDQQTGSRLISSGYHSRAHCQRWPKIFKYNAYYIEGLGFVAVFTESMLGMPQLMQNYRKKSTRGMSVEMVVMWLSGDLFKTLYFILRHAPGQFIACGSIQVTVDLLILLQVFWFRRPNVTYRKLPKSR